MCHYLQVDPGLTSNPTGKQGTSSSSSDGAEYLYSNNISTRHRPDYCQGHILILVLDFPPSLKRTRVNKQRYVTFALNLNLYVGPTEPLDGSISLFLLSNRPFNKIFIPLGRHPNGF